MTQRAAKPWVQSLTTPVSAAMRPRRVTMEPVPPAPALFTLDNKVSAGWEMMAATTPATTPEDRETETFSELVHSLGDLPMDS